MSDTNDPVFVMIGGMLINPRRIVSAYDIPGGRARIIMSGARNHDEISVENYSVARLAKLLTSIGCEVFADGGAE